MTTIAQIEIPALIGADQNRQRRAIIRAQSLIKTGGRILASGRLLNLAGSWRRKLRQSQD
jgi:hypothetical protein